MQGLLGFVRNCMEFFSAGGGGGGRGRVDFCPHSSIPVT